jgi:hypothetical protein
VNLLRFYFRKDSNVNACVGVVPYLHPAGLEPPEAGHRRVSLLGSLGERLKPGGKLAMVSLFAGKTVVAPNFELILRSDAHG